MPEPSSHTDRLAQLRRALRDAGANGCLLPVTDEYQGEYSAACARRVTWLTGFDGSAGQVAVTPHKAALFVDSRYTLQAAQEVDPALYRTHDSAELSARQWLAKELKEGEVLAYDPMLHTPAQLEALSEYLTPCGIRLMPLLPNPIDALWSDRPSPPAAPVVKHDLSYAGISHEEKRRAMAEKLKTRRLDAYLLTQPDAICWLLNIRGSDIPYNPLPLCYALLHADARVELWIEPSRLPPEVREHLSADICAHPPAELDTMLVHMGKEGYTVGIDPQACPIQCVHRLEEAGAKVTHCSNPVTLAKAIKNAAEIEGMRRAHLLDGVAVTRFLCWFDTLEGEIDELQVMARLERFREQCPEYRGPSFCTIAGSGPHGAIVHYRADEASNRHIAHGDILLLDSGGQYPFGTTDITRTIARGGKASDMFRDHYTRVLKGHIALAQAQFPAGTGGTQLDILARQPLWDAGLDYGHGTATASDVTSACMRGRNAYPNAGDTPLEPGMVLSNEPGYYREGAYGIRIENLVLVVEREKVEGMSFYGFNTLTLAPIDTRLIAPALLGDHERAWLNHYHRRVTDALSPHLDDFELQWLAERCTPV